MKKIAVVSYIFVCLLVVSSFSYAVSEDDYIPATQSSKNLWLRVEPLLLALGGLDFRLGLKTSEHTSIVLALDGHFFWPALSVAPLSQLWGLGGGLGFHWNPTSPIWAQGFYIEPIIRSGYSGLVPSESHVVIVPSVESGYKWRFNNGINLFTGLSVSYPIAPKLRDAWMPNFPIPLLHFGIGYM